MQRIIRVEGHARLIRGQPESNCPEMPRTTKCDNRRFRRTPENIDKSEKHNCLLCYTLRAFTVHRCSSLRLFSVKQLEEFKGTSDL